jgi:hypothetical protein
MPDGSAGPRVTNRHQANYGLRFATTMPSTR